MVENKPKRQIRTLSARESCRDKVSIWYGSRDNFMHGLREVLANASDAIGISKQSDSGEIVVKLEEDCETISVFDTGDGIPLSDDIDGKKSYESLLLSLFSGSNYDNAERLDISTGTNGMGLTVLNYSSSLFDIASYINGKKDHLIFTDGGELTSESWNTPSKTKHGTRVRFRLDNEVYPIIKYNPRDIRDLLIALAGANNKLTIRYSYKDVEETFHYGSLEEYMVDISDNCTSSIYSFNKKEYIIEKELNIVESVWSLSTEPVQRTFLNYTNLVEHGAVYDGFVDGMRKTFNKESNQKLSVIDIEMSFNIVTSMLSSNVEFANQTKFSTSKKLYRKLTSDYIISNMEVFKAENPQEFDKILKH
ncbi:MAG TPA: ATP-binding protein, partial [Tissierellaceae bacterium]|nr:ATP-binding protein [Tissierellaceae bacterium]